MIAVAERHCALQIVHKRNELTGARQVAAHVAPIRGAVNPSSCFESLGQLTPNAWNHFLPLVLGNVGEVGHAKHSSRAPCLNGDVVT